MTLLNQGLVQFRTTLQALWNTGKMGTGSTASAQSDTDLQTAVSASSKTLTVAGTDKQITTDYLLDSATATGNTFKEYSSYYSSTALDRIVFTGIAHSADTEVNIKKRYFIKSV